MLVRVVVGALIGTILVFTWGAVAWVGGLYSFAHGPVPKDEGLAVVAAAGVVRDGAYVFPAPPRNLPAAEMEQATARWQERAKAGPVGMLIVRMDGGEPMSATVLGRGFLIEFVGSLLLAAIVAGSARHGAGIVRRFAVGFVAVLFAVVATRGIDWNFFLQPDNWALAQTADGLIGWSLACAGISLVVQKKKPLPEAA